MAYAVDAWVHADERPFIESFCNRTARNARGEQLHPGHDPVLQLRDLADNAVRCVD
jgi:hypothetical protein